MTAFALRHAAAFPIHHLPDGCSEYFAAGSVYDLPSAIVKSAKGNTSDGRVAVIEDKTIECMDTPKYCFVKPTTSCTRCTIGQ